MFVHDVQLGPSFGSEDSLTGVMSVLARERLFIVRGTAGVGKSRLVREVMGRLPRPASYVDLTHVTNERGMYDAVASRLGIPSSLVGHATSVDDWLAAAGECVLVLDHADGVMGDVLAAAEAWVRGSRCSCVIVGRTQPDVGGASVWTLEPLAHAPSLLLLHDRIRRLGGIVTPADARALDELADRAGGVPLALEITAGWVATLGATGALRLAPPAAHPDPLADAIRQSMTHCGPEPRSLLRRVAAIPGTFDLDLVEAVADGPAPETYSFLRGLIESSLVRRIETPSAMRFEVYSPVRNFLGAEQALVPCHHPWIRRRAAELLHKIESDAGAALAEFRDARALFFDTTLSERPNMAPVARLLAEVALHGESVDLAVAWLHRWLATDPDRDDARWQVIADLSWVLLRALRFDEAMSTLDRLEALPREHPAYPLALVARARARGVQGDSAQAAALAREALTCLDGRPGRWIVEAQLALAQALAVLGDVDEADRAATRGRELSAGLVPRRLVTQLLVTHADVLITRGSFSAATALVDEVLGAADEQGDPHGFAQALRLHALIGYASRSRETEHRIYDALAAFERAGSKLSFSLSYLLIVTLWRTGRLEQAERVASQAILAARSLGARDGVRFLFVALRACLTALLGGTPTMLEPPTSMMSTEHRAIARLALGVAHEKELPAAPEGEEESFFVRDFRQLLAPRPEQAAPGWLAISSRGDWMARDGVVTHIGHRPTLVAMLAALAEGATQRPGVALTGTELAAAAWPAERIRPDAARLRVRTALKMLRQLGLGAALVTRRQGWCLDRSGCVIVASPGAPRPIGAA